MARDYKKEYRTYHGTSAQKKKRASRNAARSIMEKKGKVKKGDGKHVDHKNHNPLDNRLTNLRVISRKANLSRKK